MHGQPPSSGRFVGRYLLHDRIAAGGMATVHVGRLLGLAGFGRTVAIKRLHDAYARDPEFVAMLLDEARLTATIRHPNVVPTLDVVAEEDELLVVMEYVEGDALAQLVKTAYGRGGRVPPHFAASIVAQTLHGLHAAHEAKDKHGNPLGIVHRDVSPQNILVGTDGIARVLDFGIAKAASRSTATSDGQVKGKTAYMAPEQLQHGAVDRRTDVFAAAVVLWETLTGKRLFLADSPSATVARVLHDPIPAPEVHAPDLPLSLTSVVLRGLERDPSARYQSAEEMANALEESIRFPRAGEIGAWVREIAQATLAERAALVRQVEQASVPPLPAVTPRGSALADVIELAERRRLIGEVPTDVGEKRRVDPALLTPRSHPPASYTPRSGGHTPRSSQGPEQTELASIANAVRAPLASRKDALPLLLAGVGVLALLIAITVAAVTALRSSEPPATAAEPPPALTPVPVFVEPPPSPPPTVVLGAAPPEPAVEAPPPPQATQPPPQATTPPRSPAAHPPRSGKPSTKSAPPKVDCERDPWTVDAAGVKRIRPECR